MKRPSAQTCPACGAPIPGRLFMRSANRCGACGVGFEYSGRYYMLLLVCGLAGGFGNSVVRALFDIDNWFASAALVFVFVAVLVTAVWTFVPGLVAASTEADGGGT